MDETSGPADANGPEDAAGQSGDADGDSGGLPLFARQLRIESLAEKLRELAAGVGDGDFANRDEVAKRIVLPLLRHLGWDVGDAGVVTLAYETPTGAVDFALCHPSGDPRILVSIGTFPGSAGAPPEHPFDDCSIRALQVSVSEDGRSWGFHFPAGRGSMRNRRFARLDIVDDAGRGGPEILDTYLSFHAVKSGEAFRMAGRDYGEKRFPAEAHAAWRRALTRHEILRCFLREMEEAMGVPADPRRAKSFIDGQVGTIRWPADPPDAKPARRVGVGDRVVVYDFKSRAIVTWVVVGGEPDWENGEVSRNSPIGRALFGAREGEEREVALPGQEPTPIRIVLIQPHTPASINP